MFLTAYHCLIDLAQIEKGEKILIHSATGGVGLAAIRLARHVGAEIYATAGSETKREYLRQLGITHVYDSRSLSFYDQVMTDTNGQGVDVVLNSLSGKAITQSIKCLGKFGRFLEIGKTDIYNDASMYLKRFGENLSYFAVDIDRLMAHRPAKGKALFANVSALLNSGSIAPLPVEVYPMSGLGEALVALSKGQHIGKIIASTVDDNVTMQPPPALSLKGEGVYAITGGASGFGLELAKWMVQKGARHLSLASRSGPKSEYDRLWIEKLRADGVTISIDQLDLTDASAVESWIRSLENEFSRVNGLIHSAAVLSDVTIQNLDEALFEKVYAPKAKAALHIYEALKHKNPDFILLLSSVSAVFGIPGAVQLLGRE